MSRRLRSEVLSVLLSRPEWTQSLLAAVEQGTVPRAQISPRTQQKMLGSSQGAIRSRARNLFAVRQPAPVADDIPHGARTGRARRPTARLFRQNCATCHRLHGQGANVGPDLGALRNKSPHSRSWLRFWIPNQAVEARYVNYTAVTRSDREVSGIIVAETPSSVTLRSAGGTEETILLSDIARTVQLGSVANAGRLRESDEPAGSGGPDRLSDRADLSHRLFKPRNRLNTRNETGLAELLSGLAATVDEGRGQVSPDDAAGFDTCANRCSRARRNWRALGSQRACR